MGQYVRLIYVAIQNSDNCSKYIPIIRKFNNGSLNDIRENIISQSHVISFNWDKADVEEKKKFTGTLKNLMSAGAELVLFKDFYNDAFTNKEKREIPLKSLLQETETVGISKHLRTPIKIERLIQFAENELDMHVLYTNPNVEIVDMYTEFYLDDPIEVDDNDSEIYPPFAKANKLLYYFNGDIASDIIANTRHQLDPKVPSVDDYIKNFNYYSKHDCFIDFN